MNSKSVLTFSILVCSVVGLAHPQGLSDNRIDRPEVKIGNGVLRGERVIAPNGKEVYTFLGIPFAKPPVGDLRFKRPVPFDTKWDSPFEATKLPNACMQDSVSFFFPAFSGEEIWNPNTEVSEDCLYLNIWVPVSKFEEKTNVLFWIYGGGFYSGSSSLDIYNGATLAAEKDTIVVSSQYRLGPFGFLYFGTEDAPGNMGLLDQTLALKWVNKNIGFFGGDSADITLFGESCGAASVSYHLISPLSQDLFKRAVLMSGVATAPWAFRPPSKAMDSSKKIAKNVGCLSRSGNSTENTAELIECLRGVDAPTLRSVQWKHVKSFMEFPTFATIDGYFLLDEPKKLLQNWDTKRSDIVIGNTADEGTYFLPYKYTKFFDHLRAKPIPYDGFISIMRDIFQEWPAYERESIIFQYTNWEYLEDGNENARRLGEAIGDAFFVCPCRDFADKWSSRGLKVFYYFFTQQTESDPWGDWMGVKHGDEIVYFFGQPLNSSRPYTEKEQKLSRKVVDLFSTFARTGTPSRSWERYSRDFPLYLNLNATVVSDETSSTIFGPRAEPCAFWNIYLPRLRQKMEAIKTDSVSTPGPDPVVTCKGNVKRIEQYQDCSQ